MNLLHLPSTTKSDHLAIGVKRPYRHWPHSFQWSVYNVIPIILLLFFGIHLLTRFFKIVLEERRALKSHAEMADDPCLCEVDGAHTENMCYTLPTTPHSKGQPFNCANIRYLRQFGLTSSSGVYAQNDVNVSSESVAIVTAASDSYFTSLQCLIQSIQKYEPDHKIVVYDLGLTPEQSTHLKSLCNVLYKRFRFKAYPTRVRILNEYRWKPLIIAEALMEYSAIWYLDSSVQLQPVGLPAPRQALQCSGSGSHSQVNLESCRKSSLLLHSYSGHGIYAATHSDMYKFLPVNDSLIQSKDAKMFEAGVMLIVRTREMLHSFLKWYVACALEERCMAPLQVPMFNCDFNTNDRFAVYARCHRFDQSALNVLLANAFHYNSERYTSGLSSFFSIVRGKSDDKYSADLKHCL